MPLPTLESFRNKHAGEDIYILASGASVDFVDPAFFKGKVTIGINQIYRAIPHVTYLIRKDPEQLLDCLKDRPTTPLFISVGQYGNTNNTRNRDYVLAQQADLSANTICIYEHNCNKHTLPATLPPKGLITSYSTITTAIHLAAYMGAANILLVGHDCGTLNGKVNCSGYYTPKQYQASWKQGGESAYRAWVPTIEQDTIRLKRLIKEAFGANVMSLNPFINFGLEGHVYSKT